MAPVDSPGPGFYSRIFVVPKRNGKLRPVIDLSALNKFVVKTPFRMETAKSIRLAVRPGDWATSVHLTDAYFHICSAESSPEYLRFVWQGTTYEWIALPFGYSLAPLPASLVGVLFGAKSSPLLEEQSQALTKHPLAAPGRYNQQRRYEQQPNGMSLVMD